MRDRPQNESARYNLAHPFSHDRSFIPMTDVSTSTFSWLDSSEHERRAVLELVSALNEPGTLDELGIGSIRDTIADTLFPGTSTIQTRARYFLFIPWVLQMVEASSPRRAEKSARQLQLQLCGALDKAHGPNAGVIGREAGAALQRWPLSIYWLGLARWGIRRNSVSIPSYFATLRQPSSWLLVGRALEEQVEGRRDEAPDGVRGNWAAVPAPPPDFPEIGSFTLTPEEGHFLRERVVLTHPQAYLAHILQTSDAGGRISLNSIRLQGSDPGAAGVGCLRGRVEGTRVTHTAETLCLQRHSGSLRAARAPRRRLLDPFPRWFGLRRRGTRPP